MKRSPGPVSDGASYRRLRKRVIGILLGSVGRIKARKKKAGGRRDNCEFENYEGQGRKHNVFYDS